MTNLITLILSCNLFLYTPINSIQNQSNISVNDNPLSFGMFISEWESVRSWDLVTSDKTVQFSKKRKLPVLNKSVVEEGAVLVFTKGYAFASVNEFDTKPLLLPFYVFVKDESVSTPLHWSVASSPEELEVTLQMAPEIEQTFQQEKKDIQLRYIVLDKHYLNKHKLTAKALRSMNYKQLTALLSIAP